MRFVTAEVRWVVPLVVVLVAALRWPALSVIAYLWYLVASLARVVLMLAISEFVRGGGVAGGLVVLGRLRLKRGTLAAAFVRALEFCV